MNFIPKSYWNLNYKLFSTEVWIVRTCPYLFFIAVILLCYGDISALDYYSFPLSDLCPLTDDYMSRVALRLFDAAAARQAEVKYHSLDCYDWTDVCRKIGVSSFPTVRVYHEGDYSEYAGPTSVEGFTRLGFLWVLTSNDSYSLWFVCGSQWD